MCCTIANRLKKILSPSKLVISKKLSAKRLNQIAKKQNQYSQASSKGLKTTRKYFEKVNTKAYHRFKQSRD